MERSPIYRLNLRRSWQFLNVYLVVDDCRLDYFLVIFSIFKVNQFVFQARINLFILALHFEQDLLDFAGLFTGFVRVSNFKLMLFLFGFWSSSHVFYESQWGVAERLHVVIWILILSILKSFIEKQIDGIYLRGCLSGIFTLIEVFHVFCLSRDDRWLLRLIKLVDIVGNCF